MQYYLKHSVNRSFSLLSLTQIKYISSRELANYHIVIAVTLDLYKFMLTCSQWSSGRLVRVQ